jgi:hypothetical protein
MRESRLLGRSGGAQWLRSSILSSRTLRRRRSRRVGPKPVSAIIKATEGAAPPPPKGVAAQWPPQHGPPSPLPTFIKFADLKAAGIVNNHCALKILIDNHNFPKGRWLGSATHVWTLNEVEQWLANRPVERPVPNASDKGRR